MGKGEVKYPTGLARDGRGRFWIANNGLNHVAIHDPDAGTGSGWGNPVTGPANSMNPPA